MNQYFENDFDLSASGAISLGDASDPSPARLAEVRKRVVNEGIECVLAEPQYKKWLVKAVIEETNSNTTVIDPLGVKLKPGPELGTNNLLEIWQLISLLLTKAAPIIIIIPPTICLQMSSLIQLVHKFFKQ